LFRLQHRQAGDRLKEQPRRVNEWQCGPEASDHTGLTIDQQRVQLGITTMRAQRWLVAIPQQS
jgi:hypothetical protein